MKPDPIQRLWQLKRQTAQPAPADAPGLPPGLATRIAARWAQHRPDTGALWERVTAAALAMALVICGTTAWLRPQRMPRDDMMLSLFTARLAPESDFPF